MALLENKNVLKLSEVRKGDIEVAGGKGANLGELISIGFPVPPGFIVSAKVCESFFNTIGLVKEIEALNEAKPDELDNQCAKLRKIVQQADIPDPLEEAIYSAHSALTEQRGSAIVCAVRSSATAEDLGDASFAGQHATIYYVDKGRLLGMIKHCWASLWNSEAALYRSTQGIAHGSVYMAVVVQEMILSDVSGVTFTVNPVTGDRQEVVTESSWGMGAAIVDGRVTPDHYVVGRDGLRILDKRIADKKFMIKPKPDSDLKERLVEIPYDMRNRPTLSADEVRDVTEWSIKAEEHFGSPQDVEWAIKDGNTYMLQSRPVTAVGAEDVGKGVDGRWVLFKALAENTTEPATYMQGKAIFKIWPLHGFRVIGGRMYVDIDLVRLVMPFKITDEELGEVLYSQSGKLPKLKISLLKLPFFLLFIFSGYLVIGAFLSRTRGMPYDFIDIYRDLCNKVDADPAYDMEKSAMRVFSWSRLFDPIGRMALFINIMSIRYFFAVETLNNLLDRWVPDLKDEAASILCFVGENVYSADMSKGIWRLATAAKANGLVKEIIQNNSPDAALKKLSEEPQAQDFMEKLASYLHVHGHRCLRELDMQSVRWEENPAPLLGMIKNYLTAELGSDPEDRDKKLEESRMNMEKTIRQKLEKYPLERALGIRWRIMKFLIQATRDQVRVRENSRFYHIMGFYLGRKKMLRAEAELMKSRKLRCKDDIFFLDLDEIKAMQNGELGWTDVEDRIRERRMEHIRLSKITPPKAIGFEIPEDTGESSSDGYRVLKGQSASAGIYEGPARVIFNPAVDANLNPGEILVAPFTDPAWTPLFLTAGAAVVEVGSYLSHAGTVAREFGMPCVVDVNDCTRSIKTGDLIKVDGSKGMVSIITENGGE